jgi:microcystin-dependent protein
MINFEVKTGLDIGDNISAHVPVGAIVMWSSATAPTGWVLCDGSTLNSTSSPQYSSLYSVISNTYGGTDNTDFKLPDLRGRTVVGVGTGTGNTASGTGTITGGTSLTARSLSAWGGSESVTLTSAQSGIPAHTHTTTVNVDTHNHTATAAVDTHNHTATASVDTHNHTATASVDTHNHTGSSGNDGHSHSAGTDLISRTALDSHDHSWTFSDRAGGVGESAKGWDTSSETIDTTRTINTDTDSHSHAIGVDTHNHTVSVGSDGHGHTITPVADGHGHTITPVADVHTHTITPAASGHSHTGTVSSNTAANAVSSTSLIQPFISLNYIIKY